MLSIGHARSTLYEKVGDVPLDDPHVPLPSHVVIETVLGCNLGCRMCPASSCKKDLRREPRMMRLDEFSSIIEQLSDQPRHVRLSLMGEPLLNPSIVAMARLARQRGHKVYLTTNGTLMRGGLAKSLVEVLDYVTFSVDGATARTYESIRVGARLEDVVGNIREFSGMRSGSIPWIRIDCVSSALTKPEEAALPGLWDGIADEVNLIPIGNFGGAKAIPPEFGFSRPPRRHHSEENAGRTPCRLLWDTLYVSSECRLRLCCFDLKGNNGMDVGPGKMGLKEAWRRLELYRRDQVDSKYELHPCRECREWKSI